MTDYGRSISIASSKSLLNYRLVTVFITSLSVAIALSVILFSIYEAAKARWPNSMSGSLAIAFFAISIALSYCLLNR